MPRKKRPVGRPTEYNQDVAEAICSRIAEGKHIRDICRNVYLPSRTTVYSWLHRYEEFQRAYALAKQCCAEDLFDETVTIARKATNKTVARSKLLIDTLFKQAAKLAPRKYGDHVEQPLLPQALPAPANGDDAKVIEAEALPLEQHPLYDSMKAWGKAAKVVQ